MLLNYRRDGTAFWNQVSISPVFDGNGRVVNFVGVQADVTERVMVENERRAALAAAEETREQLRLLTDSTAAMTASLRRACAEVGAPLGLVLEGGYAVDALASSVAALMPVLGAPQVPAALEVPRHPLADEALARRAAAR